MTYNTTIYTIFLFSLCALLLKRSKFCVLLSKISKTFALLLFKTFVLEGSVAILCNLPLIQSLSITQWLDTLCGNPSLFLALLCISSLFPLPKNPLVRYHFLPTDIYFSLSTKSKLFIFVFGFILFWGNINYLWGIDLYHLSFTTSILVASIITIIAYLIQPYLGFLYLFCLVGYFLRGGNVFAYMMDTLVWLYVLLSLIISSIKMLGRKSAK